VFLWTPAESARNVAEAVTAAFAAAGIGTEYWISKIDAPGAAVIAGS
jgi:hypothetical protein